MVRTLTEIAVVEGFGAMIRELPVPPLKSFMREGVEGTALAHLAGGLFEAHARDEAGWSEEGGHRQMWEAARDAALSNPEISPEIFANIMTRRGQNPLALFPELGEPVERLIRFMVNVLAIEVFAASTFAWAEEVLLDPEVSDAPGDAATWCASFDPTSRRTSSICARRSLKSRRGRCSRSKASRSRARTSSIR